MGNKWRVPLFVSDCNLSVKVFSHENSSERAEALSTGSAPANAFKLLQSMTDVIFVAALEAFGCAGGWTGASEEALVTAGT